MLRRTLLSLLAGLVATCAGPGLQAQPGPELSGIGAVRIAVTELPRSLRFYGTLFGGELREDPHSGALYLRLGASVLQLQQAVASGVLQQDLNLTAPDAGLLRSYLDVQGIGWQQLQDDSLLVRDGDGVLTRLGPALDWEALPASAVAAAAGKPVFEALLVDETFLTVTNMQVDSMFYARLLDQTSTAVAGSQFFRIGQHARLRLRQAAVGQAAGFNYFSVLVTNTDMDAAAEAVFRAGGIVENFLPNGFSFWDPDGLRVVVRGVPQVLEAHP